MIVGSGAVIYDGIRHVLFLVPALLAVPAVALAMLDRRPGMKPRVRSLLAGGAVIVVAASLFASIRWAPYSYAFINPVAGHDGDSRSWELDYWGVTGREGVTRLEKLGLSPVYVSPTPRVGVAWGANRGEESLRVGRAGSTSFSATTSRRTTAARSSSRSRAMATPWEGASAARLPERPCRSS